VVIFLLPVDQSASALVPPASVPIGQQLFVVKFRPGFYQALLASREFSGDLVDGIKAEDRDIVLVIRVEVRTVMWGTDFHVHTNDDAKKTAKLWHEYDFTTELIFRLPCWGLPEPWLPSSSSYQRPMGWCWGYAMDGVAARAAATGPR
jgi:hypothetical protein